MEQYALEFNEGDIEAVMAFFSEESVMTVQDESFTVDLLGYHEVQIVEASDKIVLSNLKLTGTTGNTVTFDRSITIDGKCYLDVLHTATGQAELI